MKENKKLCIGRVLVEKNLITKSELNNALEIQKESGNLLGAW
jgi:hypothetical protein